jgi:hypothetical protein
MWRQTAEGILGAAVEGNSTSLASIRGSSCIWPARQARTNPSCFNAWQTLFRQQSSSPVKALRHCDEERHKEARTKNNGWRMANDKGGKNQRRVAPLSAKKAFYYSNLKKCNFETRGE